ncbi:M48 family metallopeptidase [Variovorax ginsengisoli]|uniref:Metal-dependent hydrolase n=1 Tax=Variovorax ginsengisoli TaxID=363844 RepID=A0ABT9S4C7_9BURK|nr:SprT family zinc-dependent metalloprotease [Variovorax ginsengisoli]MDP9898222.1 putative metal-dependent hydrolase [Variovorax ginsengisoli]
MQGLLQFTLDLFDAAELPPPTAPASVAPASPVQPPRRAGPDLPAIPLGDAMTPARFVHPRATREARIGDARVAYELTRGKRRTIGFVVGAEGLSVRAPRWVALRDVDAAVQEKADWIVRKLIETQQRHAQVEATRIEWRDGVSFPFLGEPVVVRLDPRHGFDGVGAVLDDASPVAPGEVASPRVLRIALAQNASATQIRDAVQAWLSRQARRIFQERLDHFAPLLGVRWKKLSLSNATTRWGSASSDGAIRLHWRLVHFRLQVIDYVVAHELSHLRVMDHSPRFWETVESVLPDYGTLRQQLKDEPIPRW